MNRFFGVVLFFATAGVMSGVLAQPPLISVVKKGGIKIPSRWQACRRLGRTGRFL